MVDISPGPIEATGVLSHSPLGQCEDLDALLGRLSQSVPHVPSNHYQIPHCHDHRRDSGRDDELDPGPVLRHPVREGRLRGRLD